ncbi:RNA 2',3'-cyclic phosphodiesterase [Xanthomonas sp. LMG 12462]|uniref:RNA 2',3'-cyclic phosphodiesterase n=1 Tax=Xanthomonas sp. LMG 12462 TaxID=1591134 RepID=UPI001264AF9C|nr:RNA 2',3'-cyclic phosphodiesterase [Xanthomonas sp. LMG 12462]KAB7772915.1 RNA 2',3'-cyclic phosphodiesterase [Xanthomonas sp. LMG 12462]
MSPDATPAGAQFSLGFDAPAARESLFFALLPDMQAAHAVHSLGQQLCQAHGLHGRALPPERLHVTLHYLGEYAGIPPRLLQQACAAGHALAASPFQLAFDQAVTFDSRARSRPLVLRGDAEPAPLLALRQALQQQLARHGVAPRADGAYLPHMTLAYVDQALAPQQVPALHWQATSLSLIRSVQGQGRYLHEASWPLRAAPAQRDA